MKNLGAKGKNVAKKVKPEPDDKEQSQRFVETAKELEVDEKGSAFNDAFRLLVPPKPTAATVIDK